MRKELEEIALIEAYLEGKISKEELDGLFKNHELPVDDQIALVEAVNEHALKAVIANEQKAFNTRMNLKKYGIITGSVVIFGLITYLFISKNNNRIFQKENTSEYAQATAINDEDSIVKLIETADETKINQQESNLGFQTIDNSNKYKKSEQKSTDSKLNVSHVNLDSNNRLLDNLKKSVNVAKRDFIKQESTKGFQHYSLDPNNETLITGEKGTEILISSNDLVQLDDKSDPVGEVTFHLKEYYSKWDFINSNLSCSTKDGEILESGGMINIKAFDEEGNQLKLKPGRSIQLNFDNEMENMMLFDGTHNRDSIIDWDLQNASIIIRDLPEKFKTENPNVIGHYVSKENDSIIFEELDVIKALKPILKEEGLKKSGVHELVYIEYELDDYKIVNPKAIKSTHKRYEPLALSFFKSLKHYRPLEYHPNKKKYIISIPFLGKKAGHNSSRRGQRNYITKDVFQKYWYLKNNVNEEEKKKYMLKPGELDVYRANLNLKPIRLRNGRGGLHNFTIYELLKLKHPLTDSIGTKMLIFQEEFVKTSKKMVKENIFKFSSKKLGWINCDRFYENNTPKEEFVIDNPENYLSILIFDDINSVMQAFPNTETKKTNFGVVPVHMNFTILQLKAERNDEKQMRILKGKTSNERVQLPEWIPYDEKVIKAALE